MFILLNLVSALITFMWWMGALVVAGIIGIVAVLFISELGANIYIAIRGYNPFPNYWNTHHDDEGDEE
jgi:hypothetical protein